NQVRNIWLRSLAVFACHDGNAAAAAAMALAVSSLPALATYASNSPSAGLVTAIVRPSSASRHCPLINSWCCNKYGLFSGNIKPPVPFECIKPVVAKLSPLLMGPENASASSSKLLDDCG